MGDRHGHRPPARQYLPGIVLAFCALLVIGVVGLVSHLEPVHHGVAGDTVGRDRDETLPEYETRARATLESIAPGDSAPRFALLSFPKPVPVDQAAAIVDSIPVPRVSAVVSIAVGPVEVPEPVATDTRADVFRRNLDWASHRFGDHGDIPVDMIDSLVVYAPPSTLKELSQQRGVGAVEALPPDAVWGAIGVRPVFRWDAPQSPLAPETR